MKRNTEFHEGDMALELAEREYHSAPPLELLNIATKAGLEGGNRPFSEVLEVARKALQDGWLRLATDHPEAVRETYEREIGLDGFPGVDEDGGTADEV